MLRDPQTRRWRWKRVVLLLAAIFVIGGSVSAYVGYRVMFARNPEVMREIRAADERQQSLDDLFAEPGAPADPAP